ncbi:septum formation inhibitor Maf [Aggregatimonas sangjinii]|uniref:Septum formation inhibitor Maf n=1 Tax=Aggregatimonas sangjinii TaxID=2583587 RepID=A0A5B7SNN0_9FLAO|nr:septum formation inhibitor Maf [Aggregatimonas sangjinii]QCW99741.1 septum formation inhibitor Maf [Aggregatimonas sangjinii]
MKTLIRILSSLLLISVVSCKEATPEKKDDLAVNSESRMEKTSKPISEAFKKYWYAGDAEITSYELEQSRYGEIRNGKAVLIYVTEPFLKEEQVKADGNKPDNVPVLKLNSTKKYLTGIYPYSIMSSTFSPVKDSGHALKVSFSAQEWCGQVYTQLNNREQFEIVSHSYFQSEGDQELELDKNLLENELWNMIRIKPEELPVGTFEVIPSLEYIRLSHSELKAYKAILSLTTKAAISSYKIEYPELERTLIIDFDSEFPYQIQGWSEYALSGFGENRKKLLSTAQKIKTLKTPYWRQNNNSYLPLRDTLGL